MLKTSQYEPGSRTGGPAGADSAKGGVGLHLRWVAFPTTFLAPVMTLSLEVLVDQRPGGSGLVSCLRAS